MRTMMQRGLTGRTAPLLAVSGLLLAAYASLAVGAVLGTAYLLLAIWTTRVACSGPVRRPALGESARLDPVPGA